jgi:hypothetical protein
MHRSTYTERDLHNSRNRNNIEPNRRNCRRHICQPDEIAATAIGEARNGSHFPEIFTQDMLPGGGTGQLLYGSQDFYPSTASPLSLILTPTSVMVNGELLTLSVPEPSTLGLIGLGLLGLAAMRRRQVCT